MPYVLTLTPAAQRHMEPNRQDAFRLRVDVTAAEDLAPEIFVYLRLPLDPTLGTYRYQFSHVASPVDLEEIPTGAPLPDENPPWVRLGYVDLLFRTREQLQEAQADLFEAAQALLDSLARSDDLEVLAPHTLEA